ncbi:Virion protein [Orf virus]|uniref:ORF065 virion protein n=2 Tax=Orf virus TaxID=10258 RepID=Q6TVQ5_ORFSA|nr:ORF065 virion protein [Orf virus]AAR98290.1 ORF065 virion protein [Orf virus]AKU76554.1 Virion protein [Orf virus]AKU76686.1 Virion protein [Orf virus]AKU76818.1 Virion protein [Orf virus]QLI57572.1 virion protein [Orf virus]
MEPSAMREDLHALKSLVALAPSLDRVGAALAWRHVLVERDHRGAPARVHRFDRALRLDNRSALRAVKAVFGHRSRMMRALFPSRAVFEALEPLPPAETLVLRAAREPPPDDGGPIDARETAAWLAELFNAFRAGAGAESTPWFCLPLAEDVQHVDL